MKSSELKKAVERATQVIQDTYSNESIYDILLEEIKEENGNWAITISFTRKIPDDVPVHFTKALSGRSEKKFKKVLLDKETLDFKGMELREVANTEF